MDQGHLRLVLGRFATGVTVITVPTVTGGHGMTANAFTSVCLDPPLILVCILRSAETYSLLQAAGVFAVNVLPAARADLGDRFAQSGDHSLSGLALRQSETGAPVLADAMAFLDCRAESYAPGGDHEIVVGRVLGADIGVTTDAPLVFWGGRYHRLPL